MLNHNFFFLIGNIDNPCIMNCADTPQTIKVTFSQMNPICFRFLSNLYGECPPSEINKQFILQKVGDCSWHGRFILNCYNNCNIIFPPQ